MKIIIFLKEVKQELKKVTWPTKQETIKYTVIVIGASLVIAVILGGFDLIFMELLEKFILKI
ncbi:MAG: preprotein translocase subunit SecE [Candidatus Pacebacteria bacterium]|nr:preprotein translocase subunit SecE [Candidatus Paceibacterota bacterium]